MMLKNLIQRWYDSLVNRAVALVVLGIVLTAVTVTLVNSHVGRQELESQVREQMAATASLVSRELDTKLTARYQVLASVAAQLSMEKVTLEQRAQLLLDRQVALRHLFNGLYLFDADGIVIAEHPPERELTGRDASSRAYFQDTSNQLTTLISEPFVTATGHPAVMVTSPIFDRKQRFIGVIGGAISLAADNFLGDVERTQIGDTGYVAVATRRGITLAHPRQDEIMSAVPESNEVLVNAMAGQEGTWRTSNSLGVNTLISVRQMDQAPWFVAVVWPAAEAFAPVRRLTEVMLWVTLVVAFLLAPLALVLFRRLMHPLGALAEQISERNLGQQVEPVRVGGGREIRGVAETFNQVNAERTRVLSALVEREAFFRSLSQSAPIGIVQTDVLGRIEFANPAFETIVGRGLDKLTQRYLVTGVYEEDRQIAFEAWREALVSARRYRGKFRLRSSSGAMVWVDAMIAPIKTDEKCIGTISVVRDITHELEVEAQLKAEQKRAESILGILHEGVLLTDKQGRIRYANKAARQFLGVSELTAEDKFFDAVSIRLEDAIWTMGNLLARDEIESLDVVLANSRGEKFDIELTMLRLNRDSDHERLVLVLRDDSERRRNEQRLSWEASHDSLTGLLNRRAFTSVMAKWLAEANRSASASVLLLIDLDHFKPVNDHGGHLLGDEMLRQLAARLTQGVRQSDSVGRLGGDEFGILLPACGLERAVAIAEQIRASIAELVLEQDGVEYRVTASIGVSELSAWDNGIKEVMARADQGCYAAKAEGRDCVVAVPL
ncbi:sensor domain-containing diguanylate cyclase [Marinobacter salicampi]|uniref:sensor domain-containing diguanylate cyclase n=1 Tax=Marinobacter salicampi TaxID=435907 RepID=UPI001F5FE0AC|nr:diguanylate cyclase [Marinobacter salicampi]